MVLSAPTRVLALWAGNVSERTQGMATTFSTDEVHPRDRLSYWREVATRGFARHRFHAGNGNEYQGSVTLGALADLGVASYECDPGEIERAAEHISSSDNDDLLICAQFDGQGTAAQDGRHEKVLKENICLLDPRALPE